jgi:murein DD-endopeptidase MepM/ murein hydrolase activator NlpD
MIFPLRKDLILLNDKENIFLSSYSNQTEIPLLPHPGAFGKRRKNHTHEGVDLYCNDGDEVFSIKSGKIIGIFPFTGEHAGTGWWNNTWSVFIEHDNYVINYGEIIPSKYLFVGKIINEGEFLGEVKIVLKKDKGRPMSMLHLEMYKLGTKIPIKEWALEKQKPEELIDPTNFLIDFISNFEK